MGDTGHWHNGQWHRWHFHIWHWVRVPATLGVEVQEVSFEVYPSISQVVTMGDDVTYSLDVYPEQAITEGAIPSVPMSLDVGSVREFAFEVCPSVEEDLER